VFLGGSLIWCLRRAISRGFDLIRCVSRSDEINSRSVLGDLVGRNSWRTANLTWYRARVGGFVDALRVCCAGSRA